MAFRSSGSGRKMGEKWGSRLTFDPEADKSVGSVFHIDDDSLIENMRGQDGIDTSELIWNISVFRVPLSDYQITQFLFNHQFIVIETPNWFWSIEKNSERILIQRSRELSCVRDYVQQSPRKTPLDKMSADQGRGSMMDLIEFLHHKDELNTQYDWIEDNCKDFSKRVYNKFAKTKYHHSILDACIIS